MISRFPTLSRFIAKAEFWMGFSVVPLSASQKSQVPSCWIDFHYGSWRMNSWRFLPISIPKSWAVLWDKAAERSLKCCLFWLVTGSLMQDPCTSRSSKSKNRNVDKVFLCLIQNLCCICVKAGLNIFHLAQSLPIQSQPFKILPTPVTQQSESILDQCLGSDN